jgi:serine/threonine-protein kinase
MTDWESFYNCFRKPGFVPGYEIQNRLGGGAFGDVYKARKQSIGKAYAIKFLKIEEDAQREAVERELEAVRHFAAIDHPNLVTIEDLGSVMGVPYLIMGYAGEDTLARRLKTGALDRDSAMLFFVQVCRGVLALHDRRLVHFDLKPSNVFLKGDVARVGDYGLSKLLTDGRMTLSFGRGTPQYMAPEILKNRADHRADIYSLGVILYESISGSLPFATDAVGGLVLREEDRPPVFPADYPARMRPVVERSLRLAPEDRYSSVGELLEDMGQTARQGDSVRVDWNAAIALAEARAEEAKEAASEGEAVRSTASDLARGAAAVARGMWEGIRGVEAEEDVVEEVVDEREASARPAVSDAVGMREDARTRVRDVIAALPTRRQAAELVPVVDALETAPGFALAPLATAIPVPPPVAGGIVGTALSTAVIAIEVLASLVAGLARGTWVGFRAVGDRLTFTSGRPPLRVARFLLFLVSMALFGAMAMTIGLFFLESAGPK